MRPAAFLPLLLILASVLAGCNGANAPPMSTGSPSTSAAPATVTDETGGIEGIAWDDEQRPVQGAEIAVLRANLDARTDAAGRFSFSGLAPGSYDLVAERIGYATASRRVDVAVGAIAQVNLTLVAMTIVEAYHEGPFVFNGYNQLGSGFVDIANQNGPAGCQKCEFSFKVNESVEEVLMEVLYTATVTNPTTEEILKYQVRDKAGTLLAIDSWGPRGRLLLNHVDKGTGDAPLTKQNDEIHMINYCDSLYVCADQKFDIHYTLFHLARMPEGFTALPPE